MKFSVTLTVAMLFLSGCAKSVDPLVCEVQERNNPEVCGVGGCLFPTGFRFTITYLNDERSEIALGDVFGSQDILQQTEITRYGGNQRDPNITQYTNTKDKPPKYDQLLSLNSVSGQMYFESLLDGQVKDTFYAHCAPVMNYRKINK